MFPRPFDYFSPSTLPEALTLLKDSDAQTKILAGGQSLIPAMKHRNLAPKTVVDISGIKELNYIHKEEGTLNIGATTTIATIESNLTLLSLLPILTETASQIADPLIRNLGTVGGNICQGNPANDLPATMIAVNASFTVTSTKGSRSVSADNFFINTLKVDVKPNEILTEIRIPLYEGKVGSAYRKVRKGSGGFAIAGVAANLEVGDDNCISSCRIAMTSVGPKSLRAQNAEEALEGKGVGESVLDNVAKLVVEASQPSSDITASAEYRRKVLGILVKDAVEEAYKRAVMGNYAKS
jgi:aerobic carbon-monoxide dehydrogenase medium subunit